MRFLRQSTTITVDIGPALDSTDGVTAETALSPTVYLSKAGAAQAARNSATAISHDARGYYRIELNTTDTNTLGMLKAVYHETGATPVWDDFMVLPAVVYDALVAGSDNLDVSVTQFGGTNGTFSGGRPEVNATHWGGTAVASAAVRATLEQVLGTALTEGAAGRLAAALTAFLNVAAPVLTVASVNQTGDSFARIGANGASLSAIPDEAGVTTLLSRLSSARAGYLDNLSAGAVAQQATLTTVAAYVDTEVASLVADMATVLSRLSSARAGYLDNLSAGAVAQVTALATAQTDLTTLLGRLTALRAGYIDNLSAGAVAQASAVATLQADTDDIQTRLPAALVSGRMDVSVGAMAANVMTAAAAAADLTTELQSGLATAAALVTAQADLDDLQTRIPAALVGGRMDSNMSAINNSNAAAVRQALAAGSVIPATIDTTGFAATTTEFEADDITEATADHYNGRVIIFTSGALLGQATSISDYSLVSGRGHFTVPALTEAPANDSTFIIV